MGRPRKQYISLEEVLDLVLPLIPTRTKIEVPSFKQWTKKIRSEIRKNPRVQTKDGRGRKWDGDIVSKEE